MKAFTGFAIGTLAVLGAVAAVFIYLKKKTEKEIAYDQFDDIMDSDEDFDDEFFDDDDEVLDPAKVMNKPEEEKAEDAAEAETAEEKDFGISAEVLRTQLKIGFHDVPVSQVPNIWVAYEPVWSIGVNGTPASADYAEKMHKVIKACLREIFGDVADEIPVLYGGSVNPGNANELIVQPSIDGLFTGRAAWQADNFGKFIRDAKATYEAK